MHIRHAVNIDVRSTTVLVDRLDICWQCKRPGHNSRTSRSHFHITETVSKASL